MAQARGALRGGNPAAAAARRSRRAPPAQRPRYSPPSSPPSSGPSGVEMGSFELEEETSDRQSRGVFGNMADRAEDYLESLLIDAFKGKGFQKIDELLQYMKVEPPQIYSESLFNQLDKALRKELDKNEFKNVSLLLKCIQIYLNRDFEEGKSLFIEQGLVAKLVSWFERTRSFLTVIDPNENEFLILLFGDFFTSALVIWKCSNEGKKELVNLFLPELGRLVTESNLHCVLHLEALRTLNTILEVVPREQRKTFPLSEEIRLLTKDLAKAILEIGDYDLQVGLSEALCRFMTRKWRVDLVHYWFEDNYLAEAFKEINDGEFETDCRKFLNLLNERLGDKRRVYTFPCISAFAGMSEMKKPSEEKLEEFWIDFNVGSQSVTFYVACHEGDLWDSVRLSKENVKRYSVTEKDRQKIVRISLKMPAALQKIEAVKFKLVFSAEFEILSVLTKVLGDEKLMMVGSEDEIVHSGKETIQSEAETPVPSNSQRRKDPSDSENLETQKDNLTSQHRQQLTGTVAQKTANFGVAMVTVSQQTDLQGAKQGKNSKTPSSRMKAKPSEKPLEEEPIDEQIAKILRLSPSPKDITSKKKKRKTSSPKKRAKGRKELYDFEKSDSSSHKKISKAKEKVLAQKTSSKSQRTYETRSKSKELNSPERKQSSYRKHLFSESNNENTSTGLSEKSWILNTQIQETPKAVDYSRKRPRVSSKIKVLPVSSASSDSDYEPKKKRKAKQRAQKEMQRKESVSSSKGDDLPTVNLADEVLSDDPGEGPLLLDLSAKNPSSDVEKAKQEFLGARGKLSREEENSKWKDSDTLSGTVIKKPEFSSLEKNHLPSEINHTPEKISDSVEDEVEMQKGQEMVNSIDDVVFSKMFHEDLSDSEVIFALERFIDQLKKYFLSRYKRIEMSAQDVLRSSEKSLSAQLNQIHKCRLNKFETLRKIVVEELANLERETRILAAMEKDAVDFWNAQQLKLNMFFSQQNERTESVDSALGETAKSFSDTVQNTVHEHSVKKAKEDVFIAPSD